MKDLIYITYQDIHVSRRTQMFLEKEGYEVRFFESTDELYEAFLYKKCSLVIIDIGAPGSDGFAVCAKIKQLLDLPVIVLTSPLSQQQLSADIKALLIVANPPKPAASPPKAKNSMELSCADVTIYLKRRVVVCSTGELDLTRREYHLLIFMMQNQHKAMTREELFSSIWGDKNVSIKVTDDTIKRIRKKLAEAKSSLTIATVRGFGFKLGLVSTKEESKAANEFLDILWHRRSRALGTHKEEVPQNSGNIRYKDARLRSENTP